MIAAGGGVDIGSTLVLRAGDASEIRMTCLNPSHTPVLRLARHVFGGFRPLNAPAPMLGIIHTPRQSSLPCGTFVLTDAPLIVRLAPRQHLASMTVFDVPSATLPILVPTPSRRPTGFFLIRTMLKIPAN